jgi:hypothetical protein
MGSLEKVRVRPATAIIMTAEMESKPKHPLRDTTIAAVVLGALFSLHGMASGLVFVAIVMAFWLPYSLVVIIRNPDRRKIQSTKIGIWVLMFVTVLAGHFVRHRDDRAYADSVVQKIEQFRNTQGRYPDRLEEIGMTAAELKGRLVVPNYSNSPRFYYANSMVAFHMWSYDFEKREWVDEYD